MVELKSLKNSVLPFWEHMFDSAFKLFEYIYIYIHTYIHTHTHKSSSAYNWVTS